MPTCLYLQPPASSSVMCHVGERERECVWVGGSGARRGRREEGKEREKEWEREISEQPFQLEKGDGGGFRTSCMCTPCHRLLLSSPRRTSM